MGLAALIATAALAAAPQHVDLAAGTVDGRPVLDQTVQRITSGFGRPDERKLQPATRVSIRYGTRDAFRLLVYFRNGRAWSMVFQHRALTESRLGRFLDRSPDALAASIEREYGDLFVLDEPLRCRDATCVGYFRATAGSRRITFGSVRGRTFLTLWDARPLGS